MGFNKNKNNQNNKSNGGNQKNAVDLFNQDFKSSKSGSLEAYVNVNNISDFRVRGRYMSLIKDIAQGRVDFYSPEFIELMKFPQVRNNIILILNERCNYYYWITKSMEFTRAYMEQKGMEINQDFVNAYTDMTYKRKAFETFSILFSSGFLANGDPSTLMSIPIQMNNRANKFDGKVMLSKFLI